MAPRLIRGRYRAWFDPEVPTLRAIVRLPRLDRERTVDFLVDTGAAKTTLMPSDSGLMRLDFAGDFSRSPAEMASGIGGGMRFWSEPAQILLQTESGLV